MKPFEGIMGNNAQLRIIEFLLPYKKAEFNITTLAKEVGVTRPTVTKAVKSFVEWGIMKVSMNISGVDYYQINIESSFYKLFITLDNIIIEYMLTDEELYEIHDEMEKFDFIQPRKFNRPKGPSPQEKQLMPYPEIPWISQDFAEVPLFRLQETGYQNDATNIGGYDNDAS